MTTATTPLPGSRAHTDGGWGDTTTPVIPIQTRSERPTSFDPADFGTPTGREVNWKHTPVERLAPLFEDADTESGDSNAIEYTVTVPESFRIESNGHDAAVRGEHFRPEDIVSAMAWKQCANALHIRVPANEEHTEPLRIDMTGRGGHANAHVILEAMPNSRATIVLYHSGSAQYAQNVEIIARDGANLTVITVQKWDDDSVHAASHQARVDRDASLTHVVASFGGGVVRVNPSVELAGAGASGKLYGVWFADAAQHIESQVYLHHKGAHTTGDVLYKGALQGVGARTVWVGDVLIGPDAVGTDTYEANRNLVLTDGARADSVPNLEIETGDIRGAGHASATGRFDDEQLFYLQSRGISEEEARRLVVLGFLSEIVQRIGIPSLEADLTEEIERELAQTELELAAEAAS